MSKDPYVTHEYLDWRLAKIERSVLPKLREITRVTEHDDKGRIVSFEKTTVEEEPQLPAVRDNKTIQSPGYRSLIDSANAQERELLNRFVEMCVEVRDDVADYHSGEFDRKGLPAGMEAVMECVVTVMNSTGAIEKAHELRILRLENRIIELEEAATKP